MKEVILTTNAPAPIGPYSQAIRAGNFVFVSGQIALDPVTGTMVQSDIVSETNQVMNNLGAILKQAGLDYANIVKTTIFVKDLQHFAAINGAYGQFFKDLPPARETVEVSRLPKDANVEISCIATV